MLFNISQEPLFTEIYKKNAAPQNEPRTQKHTLREPAQSTCTSTGRKSHFNHTEIYGKKAARRPHFVRACAVETHVKISQEPLYTLYRNLDM
jgi:hypothetical protein